MAVKSRDLYDIMQNGGSFKIIDVSDLGSGTLGVEKLAQYIRTVREESPLLGESTYKKINKDSLAISRIDMANGILTPGRDSAGAKRAVPTGDEADADITTNSLVPKELIAKVMIDEDTLDFNLEQEAFETLIIDLLARASTEDLERYFLFADTAVTWSTTMVSKLLSINDGWLKTAGNQIYGLESDTGAGDEDFNPDTDQSNWPIPLFDAMLAKIQKKYISGNKRADFRFYVPWDIEDAYSDIVAARPTLAGDNALLGKDVLTYKKIPIVNIGALDDDTYTDICGTPALLSKSKNMYWGTKRDIRVKNQEDIDLRQLKNVLSLSADSTYEDENAAVTAWLDKEKPGA